MGPFEVVGTAKKAGFPYQLESVCHGGSCVVVDGG